LTGDPANDLLECSSNRILPDAEFRRNRTERLPLMAKRHSLAAIENPTWPAKGLLLLAGAVDALKKALDKDPWSA
jgi:hypothetical protein